MTEGTEHYRAFQKQPNVFLNSKQRLLGIGGKKKSKKPLRYVKNIGLGFKTPKEATTGTYIDKKCPFTGNVSIRGRILTGVIVKMKMQRTCVIRRDYLHYVPKYSRFEKRHKNMSVHISPCFRIIQKIHSTKFGVSVQGGGQLRRGRGTQKSVSVLQIPKMFASQHESRWVTPNQKDNTGTSRAQQEKCSSSRFFGHREEKTAEEDMGSAVTTFKDLAESTVSWAKSIPPFLQLNSEDQNILLRQTWHELFLLTLAYSDQRINLGDLIEEVDSEVRREVTVDAARIEDLLTSLKYLKADQNELSCLKAVVLFKPEVRELEDSTAVRSVQEQALLMLSDFCSANNSFAAPAHAATAGGGHSQQHGKLRFAKLMFLLPTLWTITPSSVVLLFFKNIDIQSMLNL